MTIYDTLPDNVLSADESAPKPTATAEQPAEVPAPRRGCGCGCGSCLLGCLAITLAIVVVLGLGGWYVWKKLPDWARDRVVAHIDGWSLPEDQRQEVIRQVDRLVAEYKAGHVRREDFARVVDEFQRSPLVSYVIASAATEKYIAASGLGQDEKQAASATLQRVARGVFEKQIPVKELDAALDFVSTKNPDGTRTFRDVFSDDDVRRLVTEFDRIAEHAGVPKEAYQLDVGAELKRIVDRVLTQGR